jgi:outer membrane protein assembly factor BamB
VVASDGSIYVTSGNSSNTSTYDYGDSVVRLSPTLTLTDAFAPSNWATLNTIDGDLGSTNPVLVDSRVFQVGKSGVGYLLAAAHLGGIGGQLASGSVCPDLAMGGVSHSGTTLFVPCPGYLAAVSVAGDKVAVTWRGSAATPGPAIVTTGAVWTVATGSGTLVAFNPTTGATLWSQSIGSVPSRFTSPAAGDGRVVVAVGSRVLAFGD